MLICRVAWTLYREEVFLLGTKFATMEKQLNKINSLVNRTHRFTHLQHTPFTYRIQVNNASSSMVMGTCRIFLSPKFDERGQPMLFRDQRLMMTEMDKFIVSCKFTKILIEVA